MICVYVCLVVCVFVDNHLDKHDDLIFCSSVLAYISIPSTHQKLYYMLKASGYTYYQIDIFVNISCYQKYWMKTNGRIVVAYTTNWLHRIWSAPDDLFIQMVYEQIPLAPVLRSFTFSNPV